MYIHVKMSQFDCLFFKYNSSIWELLRLGVRDVVALNYR